MNVAQSALLITPAELSIPHAFLSEHYIIHSCSTVQETLAVLKTLTPDLVLISTQFSVTSSLQLLEAVKNASLNELIPIVFVIDFHQRVITFPGTTWAGEIGIIHRYSSAREVDALVARLQHR